VLSPHAGGELTGYITSHQILAVWTHFRSDVPHHEPRTKPCVEPQIQCEGCRRNLRRIWKGYLGCYLHSSGKPFVAEITAEAARQTPLLTSGADLRGMLIRLVRPGRSRRGRVWAYLSQPARQVDLPPPMQLVPILARLWGFQSIAPTDDTPRPEEGGGA
jgi:hypothetical protein